MILHAASIAAFFVDQLVQAPVQIQCVQQSTPESWLKWLLPTIVQTVVSLLSIFAGVGIAVRSFRANKKAEHDQWVRNQQAGHEQWVLDHKKAEWAELLASIRDCEDSLPLVDLRRGATAQVSTNIPALEKVRKLQQILGDRLFIDSTTMAPIITAWVRVTESSKSLRDDKPLEIYVLEYNDFVETARKTARKDLNVEELTTKA
jgi:hypothetical protein